MDPLRLRSAGCRLRAVLYAYPRIGQNVPETQVIVAPQTVDRLAPRWEDSLKGSRPCSPGSPPSRGQASTSEQTQLPPLWSQQLGAVRGESRLSKMLCGRAHSSRLNYLAPDYAPTTWGAL